MNHPERPEPCSLPRRRWHREGSVVACSVCHRLHVAVTYRSGPLGGPASRAWIPVEQRIA